MTPQEWERYRQQAAQAWQQIQSPTRPVIWVSTDSGALGAGAAATLREVERWVASHGNEAVVRKTASFGTTWLEPVVDILKPGRPRITYGHITADKVASLLDSYLAGDDPRADLAYASFGETEFRGISPLAQTDWWRLQHRILLARCGWTDPESLEDYVATGGYSAFTKALLEMSQEEVIQQVKDSNVRGRGGAGFPAGIKWESAHSERSRPKFIICNSHEGEPNVFKDRRLMEGDPHGMLEGVMIAAYAVGSEHAYVYIGSEYPLAIGRVQKAVRDLNAVGLLGKDVLGTGFNLKIKVIPGAGAYISGEASAAIYGIQGQRGMPRTKPPRSAEAGLWGKPTVVNNTETLANVPHIVLHGSEWYRALGTEKSTGTKLFSLAGDINRVCLAELKMGCTLRDLIFVTGGGMRDGARFRSVLAGGISGGALPESALDLTNEFGTLETEGSMMGSGGYLIYDEGTCMVDLAYYCTRFNRDESCGKCVPCRVGTASQLNMLEDI
ncbi:MAG: NADH-quinone oxidoreductase subunit F, partial [Chloroflexota bacterium]|nr:NADH-quinone oxidoreductase subunit F [Chloroflexota bacterium]